MKTQDEVNYRIGAPNFRCGMCCNYRVPKRCRVVEGEIDSDGVCDSFNKDHLTVED